MDLVNNFGKQVDKLLKMKNVKLVVVLCIALYAGAIAPALPNVVIEFFDTIPGKLLFLFVIGYMASRDVQIALMIAVAFLLTLHIFNKRVGETYRNVYERFGSSENFSGGDVCGKNVDEQACEDDADADCEWDDETSKCQKKEPFTNQENFDDQCEGDECFANQGDDSVEGFAVNSGTTESATYSPL